MKDVDVCSTAEARARLRAIELAMLLSLSRARAVRTGALNRLCGLACAGVRTWNWRHPQPNVITDVETSSVRCCCVSLPALPPAAVSVLSPIETSHLLDGAALVRGESAGPKGLGAAVVAAATFLTVAVVLLRTPRVKPIVLPAPPACPRLIRSRGVRWTRPYPSTNYVRTRARPSAGTWSTVDSW
eukprot:352616-Chlamydomonas_euryale.AAC.6